MRDPCKGGKGQAASYADMRRFTPGEEGGQVGLWDSQQEAPAGHERGGSCD